MIYIQTDLTKYIIKSKPQVMFKKFIGDIDATFDFSNVHKDLHQAYFNFLHNMYIENNKPVIKFASTVDGI